MRIEQHSIAEYSDLEANYSIQDIAMEGIDLANVRK
jgi:hypothetical protein